MEARLPPARKAALLQELQEFHRRTKCTQRELLSLIGKMSFACKVVPAGRISYAGLLSLVRVDDSFIITCASPRKRSETSSGGWNFLNLEMVVVYYWNPSGHTRQTCSCTQIPQDMVLTGQGRWLTAQRKLSIEWKELYAIVVATAAWGHLWSCKRLLFYCDNQAVCTIWSSGISKDPKLMQLVRQLYFIAAKGNFTILVCHIGFPGDRNLIADTLSRFQVQRFHQLAPEASLAPTPIPANMITGQLWLYQFASIASSTRAMYTSGWHWYLWVLPQ